MKRSEAINILQHKVCCPHEIIRRDMYDSGVYYDRAKRLLDFIEKELGMIAPPVKYLISPIELGVKNEWEPENDIELGVKNEWEPENDEET